METAQHRLRHERIDCVLLAGFSDRSHVAVIGSDAREVDRIPPLGDRAPPFGVRCSLMRRALALLACAATLVAGCGGGGESGQPTAVDDGAAAATVAVIVGEDAGPTGSVAIDPAEATSLGSLLGLPSGAAVSADDVILAGSADLPAGQDLRLPFAILGKGGEEVIADGPVQVFAAEGVDGALAGPFSAEHRPVGVTDGGTQAQASGASLYVAQGVKVPAPGLYDVVAVFEQGGVRRAAAGQLRFTEAAETPEVGDPAPASDTPTLDDVKGDATALTTRTPPDTSLLELSVADALAAKRPFVVVFATPKFCTSRICGPVVDVVLEVQRRLAATPMAFIHVEIFEGNDPQAGPNRWVQEWRLPTEPWVFVVGADGRIAAKFEGAVGLDELEAAARAVAGGGAA